MMRTFACLRLAALLCAVAFGQSTETNPKFEAADIHTSAPSLARFMNGPFNHGGTYELRTATMLDLISTAYGMDREKVFGGPSWLEMDRFDVIAKLPAGSTPETRKSMLRTLLSDRFHLAVHADIKPLPGYALTVGKRAQLKPADGSGEPGCKMVPPPDAPKPPAGAPPGMVMLTPMLEYSCHNLTMKAFADGMSDMIMTPQSLNGKPVVDETELNGAWDFNFRYSLPIRILATGNTENITLFDAFDKQLGLKLEPARLPMPVLVVDSVNQKPTPNPPDVAKLLPVPPTEFDVAEIKPSDPNPAGAMMVVGRGGRGGGRGPAFQNGRVNLQGYTLKNLILTAWDLNSDDMVVGAPKWADTDRFDVIAKVPGAGPTSETGMDMNLVLPMLRALIVDKFKLTFHNEDRPVSAYTLSVVKSKLKPADPSNRTTYFEGPAPDAKDPRDSNPMLSRLVTCRNMTMAQFAALLPNIAGGYIRTSVQDATGLDGAWDFTLSFSPAGAVGMGPAGGRAMAVRMGGDAVISVRVGGDVGASPASGDATDPNGAVSLFDALTKQLGLKLEMQKRPIPVMVIDHVEQKIAEN